MPPHNFAASNKRSRATAGPSDNEPILPLPFRISYETNRMWYNANLKINLWLNAQVVGERVVKSNGLEVTWKIASLIIGTNIAPQSPNQTNDLRMIGELREITSASDVIMEFTIKRSHYWWDESESKWRLVVQEEGDDHAQVVEEQAADVVKDNEEDDFQTVVIDRLEHLQIWQEEIQHQLQIHQDNIENQLQSVEEMMQCQHDMNLSLSALLIGCGI
ncbi:hypothetical protein M9H77_30338 [Catharanthus roseus]|uniref:Uncharacterized protein n=1 Tax=Catharanthus roseus TaxID=4058 RepID=A0ACB9ZXU9_CATRO|nr:hypothetical protein M9H77_30338 [Catharanthus roseus]